MASLKACARVDGRAVPVLAASNAGDLPLDVMHEILLRLPAKVLCRLRTVCRFWQLLLSDPEFVAAHAAFHRELPLIITGYNCYVSKTSLANIMDLSGDIIKQVRLDGHCVMSMPLNHVFITSIDGSCRLVDPATSTTMYHVWEGGPIDCNHDMSLFGQVPSTAEYKAFRKVTNTHVGEYGFLYEVCTLSSGSRPRWRAVQGPPNTFGVPEGTSVAIDGIVYLLMAEVYFLVTQKKPVIQQDRIYSFDLEIEKWKPNIKGPQGFFLDNASGLNGYYRQIQLSLTNLNGSLVIVHGPSPNMDIWFLMSFEKGLWVKQYSIQIERVYSYFLPVIVLQDGSIVIVIHVGGKQTVEIHNSRRNTFSILADTSRSCAINVYTGNLLSLGRRQPANNEVRN